MEKISVNSSELTIDSFRAQTEPSSAFQSTISEDNFIFIILDCYTYTAGEKVTGEILLNLVEPLPKALMKFQSQGLEEVTIYDAKERLKIVAEEKSEVYSIDSSMQDWEEQIYPGQYVFPFTLKIPTHSPSTFLFSSHDQRGFFVKAEIRYSISVFLSCADQNFSLFHQRELLIKNKNSLSKSGPSTENIETVVGCCSSKGNTRLKLKIMNNDHCEVNSEVLFKLEPDNSQCRAPINQVISRIMMEFTAVTKRGEFKIIQNVATIDRAAWIGALSSMAYEKDFEYHAGLKTSENNNASSNLTPIIKCIYYVEVLVFYDILFRKTPASVVLSFHVNPTNNLAKLIPKLPNNWNPKESSIFAFSVDGRTSTMVSSEYMHSIISPEILSNS